MQRNAPVDVVARARRMGPLPWSALGRRAAVEPPAGLGPWLAGALDRAWAELGRPDPFVVVDAGAGDGSRAAGVLASDPACATALRWLLVDDDPEAAKAQRRTFASATPSAAGIAEERTPVPGRPRARSPRPVLEDPALVLGPAVAGPDADDDPAPPKGIGPLVASLSELPAGLPVAVVLAVGWLSRLPVDCFEWGGGRWWEVRLAAGDGGATLDELLVDAAGGAGLGAGRDDGDRVGRPDEARRWLVAARRVAGRGRVVAVDRLATTHGRDTGGLDLGQLRAGPSEVVELGGDLAPLFALRWPMLGG